MKIAPSTPSRAKKQPTPKTPAFVPLKDAVVRTNGGQRCDMERGPCACGAWH